jgi:hypothetical protein
MIRKIYDALVDRKVDCRERHLDSMREALANHAGFFEFCQGMARDVQRQAAAPAATHGAAAMWEALRQQVAARVNDGRASSDDVPRLLQIAHSLIYSDTDRDLLDSIIKWNELPLLHTHSFYVVLTPERHADVSVTQVSKSQWLIEMTFGFRTVIGEAVVLLWESLNGRCRQDPAEHLASNIQRLLLGQNARQYPGVSIEHVAQTGLLACFAKMFVFSHELGHVVAHWSGERFNNTIDEEFNADRWGQYLYTAAALMLVPPFGGFVASGRITNSAQRRAMLLEDPALGKAYADAVAGIDPVFNETLISQSHLYKTKEEMHQAACVDLLVWAMPIFVFRLVEVFERTQDALGLAPTCATHPSARDRIERHWALHPKSTIRRRIETHLMPAMDALFTKRT